ncbi:hypothetical protein [Brevifollis gellanilyticus]|uniref:Uncharacterized protein n=1 Tax=Brevifollis gellanilyticus TaxID=748831 RepID=A0A512M3A1_9BACT|nr:hypothetical protein [Brevifollis gellanilyticus]GEP41224.1 hypothetical protein BGE01nite_05150 [Brevifollis gellanilyticus]
MCCFSGTQLVQSVSKTRIFGRQEKKLQHLIYSMSIVASDAVAMVLPVPVVPGGPDDAMKFADFSGYPKVFDDLELGFRPPVTVYRGSPAALPALPKPVLEVKQVGAYEASFVPTIADFSRLDARFRLPDDVWKKLPGYAAFGFAVFKLRAGAQDVHPMAFSFPTARPGHVFFPTLHIHDGEVHAKEHFDHTLYLQGENLNLNPGWQGSPGVAMNHVKCEQTHHFVLPEMHVHRRRIYGKHANGDIVLKPLV